MRRPMSTLLSVLVLLSSALLVTDAPALGAEGIPCNGEVDLTDLSRPVEFAELGHMGERR